MYEDIINRVAQRYGVDPRLIYATIMTESAGNPNISRYEPHLRESSWGLGQILESTARSLGFRGTIEDLKNPEINIDVTAR